jgi:uncharacterized membrane protein required for colicin V production
VHVNAIDVGIVLTFVTGALIGAHRGVLRQVAIMAAFYASLVFAARNYGTFAELMVEHLAGADYGVASAYTLLGLTAVGTVGMVWLSRQVYQSTTLPGIQVFDRLAGAGLGVVWSWAVIAFAITILVFGLSFPWGTQEPTRRDVGMALTHSQLIGSVRAGWPRLLELVRPWLPGGLPAPLTG